MLDDMYQGVGYSTKKGFINTEVGQGARPLRQMSDEECKAHVVRLVLAQMYNLRKSTELFDEKAEQATMTELSQIHDFETYRPFHKHDLSEQTEGADPTSDSRKGVCWIRRNLGLETGHTGRPRRDGCHPGTLTYCGPYLRRGTLARGGYLLFESRRRKMSGIIGVPGRRIESHGIRLSRQ